MHSTILYLPHSVMVSQIMLILLSSKVSAGARQCFPHAIMESLRTEAEPPKPNTSIKYSNCESHPNEAHRPSAKGGGPYSALCGHTKTIINVNRISLVNFPPGYAQDQCDLA
jgi:hypothetical protein